MPIIGESGPLTFGGSETSLQPPVITPPVITPPIVQPIQPPAEGAPTGFSIRHRQFINQINTLGSCFKKEHITGFTNDEFEEHTQVAEIDKFITKMKNQPGIWCTEQSVRDTNKTLQRYYD